MGARANDATLTSYTSTQNLLANMPITLHVWCGTLEAPHLWEKGELGRRELRIVALTPD